MLNFLCSNEALFLIQTVVSFLGVILAFRFFGKTGLFAWCAFITVFANLEVNSFCKMFGMAVSLGNTGFCSLSFAQDLINESYGKKVAKKSVTLGLFASISILLISQISCMYNCNGGNYEAFHLVFAALLPVLLASLTSYFCSNRLNVLLYSWVRQKTDKIWIKTQFSSQLTQIFDSCFFTGLCVMFELLSQKFNIELLSTNFYTDAKSVIELMFTTYVMKAIIVLAEIPGMKIAKRIKNISEI